MGRIALIIPYFGTFPNCLSFFLESVAHSPILNVLIFTDETIALTLPANVTVYTFSVSDFERMASQHLSLPISLKSPFKLCDFKPAFGDIFESAQRNTGG